MVFWFEGDREAMIVFRIFMTAVDFRFIGQSHELFKRSVHLLGGSLKEAAASCRKQRIATKKIILEKISDVAGRVTRNEENFAAQFADANFVPLIHTVGQPRNSCLIALVAINL